MQTLSGKIVDKLVAVDDNATWLNLELSECVIVGGPSERFGSFFNVSFLNCVFLYNGMEVSGNEWLSFMSMDRMPVREPSRRSKLQ